jgi:hypothetical protein
MNPILRVLICVVAFVIVGTIVGAVQHHFSLPESLSYLPGLCGGAVAIIVWSWTARKAG